MHLPFPLSMFVDHRHRSVVIYECRRCGTTLHGPNATCPMGCSAGVARYEV